ncbi:phage major tail protein, TP901-1 family [Planococcus sp. ANT_H30]|uniref:phage major tail protein, TP901-1 family n=1 Tax=Planococcus sp. ANT_H30 TaxID=2597347 RepID=UPI0011ED3BAE|nr:phage major tail protein, TP901-1 family [Planococcus sp. ANT_H30]KAA0956630.1 phage major tail protein, TP901-1 family [Planococcus sp. ANT_H30]
MKQGKDIIFLVQLEDAVLGKDGYLIGNQTDGSHARENDVISETTKFGRIVGYGQNNESIEMTAYGETDDPGQEAIITAICDKKQLKVWKVNLKLNASGSHDAYFAYTIVESVEESYPQDGFVELSSTMQVIDQSQKGTIPALPPEVLAFAKYGFEAPGETTGAFPDQTTAPVIP